MFSTLASGRQGEQPCVTDDFTVAPAAPVKLVFTTQPANAIAGATLAPVVLQIHDAYGNLETGDNSAVSLTIASGPKFGSFTGSSTTTVNALDGVATFQAIWRHGYRRELQDQSQRKRGRLEHYFDGVQGDVRWKAQKIHVTKKMERYRCGRVPGAKHDGAHWLVEYLIMRLIIHGL